MRRLVLAALVVGTVACRPTFPAGAALGVARTGADNRIWWPAATDPDEGQSVASYRIDVDGVPLATVPGDAGTCTLAGLPEGSHDVRVTAYDTAGEWSASAAEQGSVVGQVAAGEPVGGPATCVPTMGWHDDLGSTRSTSVSAGGRRVASFGADGPYLWDRTDRSGRSLGRPMSLDAANPPDLSADGRHVAFVGPADPASPGPEATWTVLVWDTLTDVVEPAPALPAGHAVLEPAISGDGRFVTYTSRLATSSTWSAGSETQVWLWDRLANQATSVSPPGVLSGFPDVSADGSTVVFTALAAAGADPPNGAAHIHTYDVATGTRERIPHALPPGIAGGTRVNAAVSADGGTVVFEFQSTRHFQLVVWERATGVSTDLGPPLAAYWHREIAISGDGSTVVFNAPASAVVPGDPDSGFDVFLWNRDPDRLERVTDGNGSSSSTAVSADGDVVTFRSSSSNLLGPDGQGAALFAWDRTGQPGRA